MSADAASTEAPAAEADKHPVKDTVEPDDLNVGLIATITIVGALLVVAIAAALTALVRSESTSYGLETGTYADLGKVRRLKEEQKAKLQGPIGWADKAKGQVSVPIDRAMELVENDIQRDPFLATIAPPATATPAPSGTEGAAPAPSGAAPAPSGEAPSGAAPAPSGEAPSGAAPPASGAPLEKAPAGDKKVQERKAPAPSGGKLVDPPSGAPVTPAAAPFIQK
jgi:hypothetical protein